MYLNVFREDEAVKLKGNACPECLAVLVTDWMGHALHQAQAGNWDPPVDAEELGGLWIDAESTVSQRQRPLRR